MREVNVAVISRKAKVWGRAVAFFVIMTIVVGVVYLGISTLIAQVALPSQANGSVIEGSDGKLYSTMIGQPFSDERHMWGRPMNPEVLTDADGQPITDAQGNEMLWSAPDSLSVASDEFASVVAARVDAVRAAHPEHGDEPVPSDLVTCSGSGYDPEISLAAARYQIERLARTTGLSEQEINDIVATCTQRPVFGLFGTPRVNVVKVNLMLDGVIL